MKVLFLVAFFSIAGNILLYNWGKGIKKDNAALQAQNTALVDDIKRRDKNDVEKSESKKENEKLAKEDKNIFDWNSDINDTAIVARLRKNCRSCSKTD